MAHPNIEADKMLDVYIYDYFMKRKLGATARLFEAEAEVPTNHKAIDAPSGFLFEWWSVFWDIFIARYKRTRPGPSGSNAAQSTKGDELQHQQDMRQQLQLVQQLILQNHIEQQHQQKQQRNELQVQNAPAKALRRQNSGLMRESAKRIHEQIAITPLQMDRARADMEIVDRTRASVSESIAIRNRLPGPGQALSGIPADNLLISNHMQGRSYQLRAPQVSAELRNLMNPLLNLSAVNLDGSFNGVTGSNQGANKFPLNGWPLMGIDRLQVGLLQQQKSIMLTSQQLQMQQLQMLPDLQKDINVLKGKGSTSGCIIIPNDSLQVQESLPIVSRGEAEASNSCITRKRKQPPSSSDITNSLETAKTRSLPADSAPSTPSTLSTQMTVAIAVPTLSHDDSAKACTRASDGLCTITSLQNQLVHVGDPMNARSVNDNVEILSHDVASAQCLDTNNEFTFSEIGRIHAMASNCFDLSSNGKLIATGGLDKKVILWCTSIAEPKCMIEEHTDAISDIRFGPRLPRLATSSLDATVKIWDVNNPGNSSRTFIGHSAPVISVDFHPSKEDLVCSCDDICAIRYWSIRNGGCAGVSKGGATQVRFQPTCGRLLAAAVGTGVSMIDVETTQTCRYPFKGHALKVRSVCWNAFGEYLASMSEDSVRVWKIGSGEKQESIHELSVSGKKFHCCIFHPYDPSLMVIGLEQSLELWHMAENKMMTVLEDTTTALAVSRRAGLVASASDDNLVRLWK